MKFIPNSVTRTLGRQILKTKMNSPHIFFGAGIVGVIGSTVLACRSTLKLEETLDEIQHDVENAKEMSKVKAVSNHGQAYTEQDYYRDLGYVYGKSVVKLGRLYGPAIIVGGISVAALTGSHVQLTRRNTALTAAVAAVSKAFEDYRGRVREEIGEERELEIKQAVSTKQAEIEGKKQAVKIVDPNGLSPYARFFDETCPNYKKNAEINRVFIQCQQNYANHLLHARGHVLLNDVYELLGFERSSAGSVVGWLREGDGDGYVDFGLFEATPTKQAFIKKLEPSISKG
jgi:hypothetical protein